MTREFEANSGITIPCGLAVVVWAIGHSAFDYFYRARTGSALDVGLMYGVGAHGVAGGFAVLVGLGLRKIEKRLDRLEIAARKE